MQPTERRVERFARTVYSALLIVLSPLYVARLWWRGRAEPLYRQAIVERFGRYVVAPTHGSLWVHAVSLGETRAASALVAALRRRLPDMPLLLTHGTATGREAGRELLRSGDHQCWLPFDTPGAVRRFLAHFRPSMGVLMETESWPNLLHVAQQRGVPVMLANARLSERSLARGQQLRAVMRPAARALSAALAQTEDDARRLREAGVSNVSVCGNLKFDISPDEALCAVGRAWRHALGRPVVLAAVTREGEEAMLLRAWCASNSLKKSINALLVIVPRHPQRFDEVASAIESTGLSLARRSSWDEPPPEALSADAWLGDSMREMPLYYALADVALLGGSYAPVGGQNLIEAAACGCPLVMGPHTFNFDEAARLSLAAGAARRVADMNEAVEAALALVQDEPMRRSMMQAALAFAQQHRGAADRTADAIVAALRAAAVG